jgi:hypothetical protein
MGFNSSMPYSLNPQLQQQVDEQEAQRNDYKNLIAGPQEDVMKKQVWANGMGDNINGSYSNSYFPNQGPNPSGSFSFQQNQDRQDLLTYGPNGKPNITNNNMNNTQDPSLIDPANVGESGQLNTFNDPTRQVAGQTYGGQLEKTASMMNPSMSPLGMKKDPREIDPSAASAAYNAMNALKSVQNLNLNQGGKTNYRRDTDNVYKSIGLPGLPTSSTGSGGMNGMGGSYSNPASAGAGITINTAPPGSTTPKYSFLTDQNNPTFDKSKLNDSEHRNSLGFFKRDKPSLEARIKDANFRGKTKRATRLGKKLTNFTNNQKNSDNALQRTVKKIGSLFS